MEEKESTGSGSLSNSAESTESPTPVCSVGEMMTPLAANQEPSHPQSLFVPPPPPSLQASQAIGMNLNTSAGAVQSNSTGDALGANKKKRGRPKKYDADGNLRVRPTSQFHSVLSSSLLQHQGETGFSLSFGSPGSGHVPMAPSNKRGRGRPTGTGNWQLLASLGGLFGNTAGGDFTAHVVTVNAGEDVAGKILSFSQKGSRGICVLSANGAVSNVALRQSGSAGGVLTYEGRFEILTLTGSYTITESWGARSRTGGLSVSLASTDGRVIGGGVAGLLMAASPIQIVVGSFTPSCFAPQKKKYQRQQARPPSPTPISQAKPEGAAAPAEQSFGRAESAAHANNEFLNEAEMAADQRPSPDINVSLLNEEDVPGLL